jgi:hypothetical protein
VTAGAWLLALALGVVPARGEGSRPPPVDQGAEAASSGGWIGVGGRNAVGTSLPLDQQYGGYVLGGLWTAGGHLQPMFRLGWSRGGGTGVIVDTARAGALLAVGSAMANERLWLGGSLGAELVGAFPHGGATSATSWGITIPLSAVIQGRLGDRFLMGFELGPELSPAPMRFAGTYGQLEWGILHFNAGLRIGIVLGSPAPSRGPSTVLAPGAPAAAPHQELLPFGMNIRAQP